MSRPVPNPGILDIAPYTPGKSPVAEPGRKVFKLSANETPFGPSPKAIAAYKHAAEHLEDYPEGTSRVLREAIGRAYGLDPNRIICGAGSDELIALLTRAYLAPERRDKAEIRREWFAEVGCNGLIAFPEFFRHGCAPIKRHGRCGLAEPCGRR